MKLKRLTDEEIRSLANEAYKEGFDEGIKRTHSAQLKSELKKVKEEIEKQLGIPKTDKPFQISITIFSEWWNNYWKGKGIE